MKVNVEVIGIASVKKFLNVDSRFDTHAAFTRSARIVQRNARDRAPVDTGHLRRNISYYATPNYAIIGVDLNTVPYAWYQEAGTSKMQAHPYLRPGLEASAKQIGDIFRFELQKAVHGRVSGGNS